MNVVTSNDFLSSLTGAVAVVPIIIAVVQAIKMVSPKINGRFAPILSIGVGVVVAFLLKNGTATMTNIILEGVLYGLSASGLYSGVQSMKTDNTTNQTPINFNAQPNNTTTGQNIQSVQTTEQTTKTNAYTPPPKGNQ